MDDQRLGRVVRALRHRLSWRQEDLAESASSTQDDVSRVERGCIASLSIEKLRRIVSALDAQLVVSIRWHGGEIDRLLDEGHASIVGWVMALLAATRWQTEAEVSFAVWGERGAIDVLAWHPPTRTLLVVEVKTELTSLEETLRRHDAKQRLAAAIAAERFGWDRPTAVCRLLVLPSLTTPRRHVARHSAVLDRAYRLRADAARRWVRSPNGSASLLLFAPVTRGTRTRRAVVSRRRVRRAQPSVDPTVVGGVYAGDA